MAIPLFKNKVREKTTTTGTGTLTLSGAMPKHQTFAAIGDGGKCYYSIEMAGSSLYEVGIGTYTASGTTLSRDTIIDSSNSNSAVDLPAGEKEVFVSLVADKISEIPANGFRLTLATGDPIATADQTSKTTLYWTPFLHDRISHYDGTRWVERASTELSVKSTDAQSGTRASTGNGIITGLSDTSQLCRGMKASGTGINASAEISTIDSATQVTLTTNSTSTGTDTITFKLHSQDAHDIFLTRIGGSFKLQPIRWTDQTNRAHAVTRLNGVLVNNAVIHSGDYNAIAANQGVLLGSLHTATDGVMEDSILVRKVCNARNGRLRAMYCCPNYNDNNASTSVTITSTTWVQLGSGTADTLSYILCEGAAVHVAVTGWAESGGGNCAIGMGDDTATDALFNMLSDAGGVLASGMARSLEKAAGCHAAYLLASRGSANMTAYADSGRRGGSFDPALTFMTLHLFC